MIVFLIFGSSELQDWAGAEKNKKPDLFLDIKDSNQRQDFIYSETKWTLKCLISDVIFSVK